MTPLEAALYRNLCARALVWMDGLLAECDDLEKKCYGEDVDVWLTVALLKNSLTRERQVYQSMYDALLEVGRRP